MPDKPKPKPRKTDKNWIQKAVKRPGALTRKAEKAGMTVKQYTASVIKKLKGKEKKTVTEKRTLAQAILAKNLAKIRKK